MIVYIPLDPSRNADYRPISKIRYKLSSFSPFMIYNLWERETVLGSKYKQIIDMPLFENNSEFVFYLMSNMPLNSGQIFNSNKIWVKLPNLSINNKCLAFDKIIVLLKGKIIAMIAIFMWESSDILTPAQLIKLLACS